MSFLDDATSENKDLEKILLDVEYFLKNENFKIVVEMILEFIDNHPQYVNCDSYSFANPIEKALYALYIEDIDEINVLPINERLDQLYYYLGLSYFYLNDFENSEKYLTIANEINPVSAPILNQLCLIYQEKHDFKKVKRVVDDLFNYVYDKDILISTYFKLSDYHYHFTNNFEIYKHLFNFYTFLVSGQDMGNVSDDLAYFKQNDIQIGFNISILQLSANLYEEANEKNLENISNYFKDFFENLAEFNNYLESLEEQVSFEGICDYMKNLISNDESEKALNKAEEFLVKNPLDEDINYKFFFNEMENLFYINSQNFDENYTLLPYDMNYCYLYYLMAFCCDRTTKFEKAEEYYRKSIEFAPYSASLNLDLINTYISRNQPVKVPQLVEIAKMCYTKEDLLKVYSVFSRNLEIMCQWDDVLLVDSLIDQLKNCEYQNLNTKGLDTFEKYNFDLGFSKEAINCLTLLNNDEKYKKHYAEAIDLNEAVSNGSYQIKTSFFEDLSESELENSYILIKEKFSKKHYGELNHILLDFDEQELETSDSYVCYCYRQVNGSLSFLFLTVSNFEQGTISKREFFSDLIIPKELVEDKEVKILSELTQFKDEVNFKKDYYRWLKFNLTGDCKEDKKFLENELENLRDDKFGFKKNDIEEELEKLRKNCGS